MKTNIKIVLSEMRIRHYIKNLLIFIPPFFHGALFSSQILISLLLGFASFSLCASFIYIINDIRDLEYDKKHDYKCNRPLAAGLLSVPSALMLGIFLLFLSTLCIIFAIKHGAGISSIFVLLVYLVLNIIYSIFRFKDIALLDIIILASGFLLRILFGSTLSGISISSWLYLVVLSGSFYLGFGKRRTELKNYSDTTRKVLKEYSQDYLTMSMYSCMSLSIVFFSLWCIEKQQEHLLIDYLWFIPIMMITFFKYNLDLELSKYSGDPMEIILGDRILSVLCIITGILMFLNLY